MTDLPLTEKGREEAARLGQRLAGESFDLVLTSPLRRARETCEIAGLLEQAQEISEAVEWNYGDYEGLTTPEIHQTVPKWTVFSHPTPNGETPQQVGARADRVIEIAKEADGDVALFAHGHFLRVLAARWIGLDATYGKVLSLSTATLSIVGYVRKEQGILIWNSPN